MSIDIVIIIIVTIAVVIIMIEQNDICTIINFRILQSIPEMADHYQ